ncbi:MAG: hypothetical protein J7500_12035 [Sphingomonas sp.]|uniref:hypothetical protein n=1 Tax=Sphingomonas sp. TaxID=28214 RepID=UPI001B1B025D|nr:hypothetical protein [Sphingomonas sp.]MBO9623430.1 hypothetical protein [Sphingomonas sp.]
MTSTRMTDENWGERRAATRRRRQRTVHIALVAAAIAFGVFAPRFVPPGPGAAQTKLILALGYMVVIAFGAGMLWRLSDELEQRRTRNAFAATGVVTFFAGVAVPLAVPVLGIAYPLMTVWVLGLAAWGIAYLVQWLRG